MRANRFKTAASFLAVFCVLGMAPQSGRAQAAADYDVDPILFQGHRIRAEICSPDS